jgi:hypothetical protein
MRTEPPPPGTSREVRLAASGSTGLPSRSAARDDFPGPVSLQLRLHDHISREQSQYPPEGATALLLVLRMMLHRPVVVVRLCAGVHYLHDLLCGCRAVPANLTHGCFYLCFYKFRVLAAPAGPGRDAVTQAQGLPLELLAGLGTIVRCCLQTLRGTLRSTLQSSRQQALHVQLRARRPSVLGWPLDG